MKNFGFGMMRLPLLDENDFESIDFEEVNKMVDLFMENGYNYFDTAYPYHDGKSEEAVKKCVIERYPRESVIIANKLPIFLITKEEQLEQIFNQQLERCGVEYFDYYLMHNVSGFSEKGFIDVDSFSFAKQKKEEGKIKKLGLSTHANAEYLDNVLSQHPEMEFVQLQINYLDWENEGVESRKCVEIANKYDLPILIMEPLKGGFLVDIPEEAEKIMKDYNPDNSIVSWALRYVASIENVMMVLTGSSTLDQAKQNIEIMNNFQKLNEEEYKIIDQVVDIINSNITVACTKCNYCVSSCPVGINIPKLFTLYNNEKIEDNDQFTAVGNMYVNIAKSDSKIASDCIKCGACIKECPQHIDIPTVMDDVKATFETELYGFPLK
ncbi:MAG: 4Fe-4S dicluster domain-containing protein [Methanosphaera stadtmanae]|jgi:hypothetical protein|nr:4Fe-4S dicluster domain-containing protein [Methanosphaera stadtmanae]